MCKSYTSPSAVRQVASEGKVRLLMWTPVVSRVEKVDEEVG